MSAQWTSIDTERQYQTTMCLPIGDLRPCSRDHAKAQSRRMEHLTTLDATFLEAEDSDPHVSLAVGGVSIVAGPPPDYGELVSAFADRAQCIPRCTQILHT